MGLVEAARKNGMDPKTARKYLAQRKKVFETTKQRKTDTRNRRGGVGTSVDLKNGISYDFEPALPIPYSELSPEAKKALADPAYFAERYFGVILMPFQVEWINKAFAALSNPDQDFILVNITTGAGKSTLLVILAALMICRERRIRGMFGSATQNAAEQLLTRLKNMLERTSPVKARWSEVNAGIAKDAESTLIADFGLFKPPGQHSIWRSNAIQVLLIDGEITSEKEPTWQAYSQAGQVIGNRVEVAIWDDVWRPNKVRSQDSRDEWLRWWEDEAEERIEPTGTLMLAMQRLSPDDLSRHVLNKVVPVEDAPERLVNIFNDGDSAYDDFEGGQSGGIPVYQHLCFKAHYEEKCEGDHGKDARAYPEGCLLYPKRVPWTKIARAKATNPTKYQLVYQQEDTELPDQLVQPIWISGGTGQDGLDYPGCWDNDRAECEIPDLTGPTLSILTVDPSPENYWGIIWWVYDVPSETRYLMDLDRHKLRVDQFLRYDSRTSSYAGIADEWVKRSRDLGHPITHIIFEKNQGHWFFQDVSHQRWSQQMGVHLIPHETYRNKTDEEFGVGMLRDVYRFGKVRLPGSSKRGQGRAKCQFLCREVTSYPQKGVTSDLLMSQWFLEHNLPKLIPSIQPLMRVKGLSWKKKMLSAV